MKKIEVWETDDGLHFFSKKAALDHEALDCELDSIKIEAIEDLLPFNLFIDSHGFSTWIVENWGELIGIME